jgi:hypothetical protein
MVINCGCICRSSNEHVRTIRSTTTPVAIAVAKGKWAKQQIPHALILYVTAEFFRDAYTACGGGIKWYYTCASD